MFKSIKKILQYPRLTFKYPSRPMDSRLFIGKPIINSSKCNCCGECVSRCPSAAIVLNSVQEKISAPQDIGVPEDYGFLKATLDSKDILDLVDIGINLDECLFCGLCEEVCKQGAIVMTNEFELAEKERSSLRKKPIIIDESCFRANSYEDLGVEVEKKIGKIFGRSLQIREVDAGSCNACDYEINALNNPFNDIERFGIHFVASPRHADMLLVTGSATRNMELALIKTYNATPAPKLVVAVGACACSGGIFRDNYATRSGIDSIVPVDVYIAGCPPRPQSIMYGILKAIDRVK